MNEPVLITDTGADLEGVARVAGGARDLLKLPGNHGMERQERRGRWPV